jgi:hypothetical protein
MDEADFLQELSKTEGHRFIKATTTMTHEQAPRGTTALVLSILGRVVCCIRRCLMK